jgi:large subunit ribosomal protein L15
VGLDRLKPAKGSVRRRKRVGRGPGSGLGKTSGRGEKGQKSRSGYSRKIGFEGGQMPLHRRLPKRGFHNIFKKHFAEVDLSKLDVFEEGTIVTPELLKQRGIVRKLGDGVVVLGSGELKKSLTVYAHRFTATARERIAAAGGKAELVGAAPDASASETGE